MIVNLRYNKETGMLESLGNYTIAEGNHLVDEVVITSTDKDKSNYNYAIEFCLYNHKHIPKTLYISPILQYTSSGISFQIPNQLTQIPGYVTAQLVGYDKTDNSVMFKSIAKNSVCFWVEESHKVLENELSQTPNVLTHLMQELEEMKVVKQNFVKEFGDQIRNDMGSVLEGYEFCKVEWVYYDRIVTQIFKKNTKLEDPKAVIPPDCEYRGWVEQESKQIWDFVFDRVKKSIRLVLNVATKGMQFEGNQVVRYTGKNNEIFIPSSNQRIPITSIAPHVFDNVDNAKIHLPIHMNDIGALVTANVVKIDGGKNVQVIDNVLYMNSGKTLVKCMSNSPKVMVADGCEKILGKAFEGCVAEQIVLPCSVREIENNAFENMTNLSRLILGAEVQSVGSQIVKGCENLQSVECWAVNVPMMKEDSLEVSDNRKLALEVLANVREDYQNTLGKMGIDIGTIGQDFAIKNIVLGLEKTLDEQGKEIVNSQSKIVELESKMTEQVQKNNAQDSVINTCKESVNNMSAKVVSVEKTVDEQGKKIANSQSKIVELENKMTEQVQKNNAQDSVINTCKESVDSMNDKVLDIEKNTEQNTTAINENSTNISGLGTQVDTLENLTKGQGSRITDCESTLKKIENAKLVETLWEGNWSNSNTTPLEIGLAGYNYIVVQGNVGGKMKHIIPNVTGNYGLINLGGENSNIIFAINLTVQQGGLVWGKSGFFLDGVWQDRTNTGFYNIFKIGGIK